MRYATTRTAFTVVSALVVIMLLNPTSRPPARADDRPASSHAPLGATPLWRQHAGQRVEAGVVFRVWAPNAGTVAVAGSFNGWSPTADALTREPGDAGEWSAAIEDAHIGDSYRYVISFKDQTLWRVDPHARELDGKGNAVIVAPLEPPAAVAPAALDQLVIYEMHVGTFHDEPGPPPGTFTSAIEKLDHLRDLGINAIEILPVAEFAGDFSWGYNSAHPFAVERAYGGREGLRAFVDAAHAREIAVILDVVYNHLGPSDLDLWRFDGWHENDGGGLYFYNDDRARTPWGHTRPDYGRAQVREYLLANARMWIEELGVDGLRIDATWAIRRDGDGRTLPDGERFLRELTAMVQGLDRSAWIIAEDLQNEAWLTAPVDSPTGGGLGFDAQWSAGFVHPVREALETPRDEERDMLALGEAIAQRDHDNPFNRVIYTESHDEVANGRSRLPEEIEPGNVDGPYAVLRSTLGAALVMTSPGVPMLFQGQEMLEDEWFHDDDPLSWKRAKTHAGIVELYRDLIALRTNSSGTTRGLTGPHVGIFHVNDQRDGDTHKVVAFHRWREGGRGDDVVVIANLANRAYDAYTLGLPAEGQWRVRFCNARRAYHAALSDAPSADVTTRAEPMHGYGCCATIALAPYSVVILSQDPE